MCGPIEKISFESGVFPTLHQGFWITGFALEGSSKGEYPFHAFILQSYLSDGSLSDLLGDIRS